IGLPANASEVRSKPLEIINLESPAAMKLDRYRAEKLGQTVVVERQTRKSRGLEHPQASRRPAVRPLVGLESLETQVGVDCVIVRGEEAANRILERRHLIIHRAHAAHVSKQPVAPPLLDLRPGDV